ncbi:MAG: hypothetical protein AAGI92_00075 [Pseudomonadota bacterium]
MNDDSENAQTPEQVASHTLALLRRFEKQQTMMMEVLGRHDERLSRIERNLIEIKRDVGEAKSDLILMENQMLNRMNEILDLTRKIDETRELIK